MNDESWRSEWVGRIDALLADFEPVEEEIATFAAEARARGARAELEAHLAIADIASTHAESEIERAALSAALRLVKENSDLAPRVLRALLRFGRAATEWPAELLAVTTAVEERAGEAASLDVAGSLSLAHSSLADNDWREGRRGQAEAHLRAALAWAREPDDYTLLRLARALAERGAFGEATALVTGCLLREPSAYAYAVAAKVHALAGDGAAAEAARRAGHALALEDAPASDAPLVVAWFRAPFEPQKACPPEYMSAGEVDDPEPIGPDGVPTPRGILSESIFGPVRDYSCHCGTLNGFESYLARCERCQISSEPSALRRARVGHVRLKTPVVHPRALSLASIVFDCLPAEVHREVAAMHRRDESTMRRMWLQPDELREQAANGRLRGRVHPIADRLAAIEHLGASDCAAAAESLLFDTLPVLPPDLDTVLYPRELGGAYSRLLALRAGGAPAEELGAAVESIFACFGPLVPIVTPEVTPTHASRFDLAAGAVVHPTFLWHNARPITAGTAFVLEDANRCLTVTCLHTLNVHLANGAFPDAVSLADAFDGHAVGMTGPALPLPRADMTVPARDVAAFVLNARVSGLRLSAEDPREGDKVYLAGAVRAGAPRTQKLHPGTAQGVTANGTYLVSLEAEEIDLVGLSGAPVLREDGAVVGMMCRFSRSPHGLYGFVIGSRSLAEVLACTST